MVSKCSKIFYLKYVKLKNIYNPKKKRKIIGNLFIKVFEKESKKYNNIKFLAQGTLYPDIIESRSSTGSKTSKIKSHHNVGGLPKKMNLVYVNAEKEFIKELINVSDPKKKRKIIGNLFIKIFERYARKIKIISGHTIF